MSAVDEGHEEKDFTAKGRDDEGYERHFFASDFYDDDIMDDTTGKEGNNQAD